MEKVSSIFSSRDISKLFKSTITLLIVIFIFDKSFQLLSFKLIHLSYNHSRWGLHQVEKAFTNPPDILILGNSKVRGINTNLVKKSKLMTQVISIPGTDLEFWINFIDGFTKVHPNNQTRIILDIPDYELTNEKYLVASSYESSLHPVLKKHIPKLLKKSKGKNKIEFFTKNFLYSYQLRRSLLFSLVGIGKRLIGQELLWEGSKRASICKKGANCLLPSDLNYNKQIKFQPPEKNESIKKLISLVESSNHNILFLFMPYHSARGFLQKTRLDSMNSVKDYLKSKRFKIYDYNQSIRYKEKNNYFADIMHLNETGANVFTRDLMIDLEL